MSEPQIMHVHFTEDNGGDVIFYNTKDLADWISEERAFWAWLHNIRNLKDSHTRNVLNDFISTNQNTFNFNTSQLTPASVKNLQMQVSHYAQRGFFHSKSQKAIRLKTLLDSEPISEVFAALAYLVVPHYMESYSGITKFILVEQGISNKANKAVANEIEKTRKDAEQKFTRMQSEYLELSTKQDNHYSRSARAYIIAYKWYNSRWTQLKKKNERLLSQSLENLAEVRQTYDEFMKLKAPVEYWSSKATEHKTNANNYRTGLFLYFPISLVLNLAFIGATGIFTEVIGNVPTITMALVFLTTCLWIGKILVRLFLSEHHLHIDANERSVMAQTYLALINDGSVDRDDREAVLSALFRPTADGIVKDDAAPILSPASFMTSRLTG